MKNQVMHRFPAIIPPPIGHAEGIYLYDKKGRKILDASAGYSACVLAGYSSPEIKKAIQEKMEKFSYLCSHAWLDPQVDELAELLLAQAPKGLDKVYYSGSTGSDSLEASMKLSYQVHYNKGEKDRTWYITRAGAYHGATLQALAVTDIDIWDFYSPILPKNIAKIPEHNPYSPDAGTDMEAYAEKGARELEQKILEIGPRKVCAFIGETMLGQLKGNVPPAPSYWKRIREVCDRYGVHLILDEVYCGLGRSGKVYCCSWDGITPDFIGLGKTLTGGFIPLSAVVTKSEFEDVIREGHGRVMYAHTHQAHPLGLAAAVAMQRLIQDPKMLGHINRMGEIFQGRLKEELGLHPFFRNVRGRGLLVTIEYDCKDKHKFGSSIENEMLDVHGIVINSRWHRASFTPPCTITEKEVHYVLDKYIETFRKTAERWPAHVAN